MLSIFQNFNFQRFFPKSGSLKLIYFFRMQGKVFSSCINESNHMLLFILLAQDSSPSSWRMLWYFPLSLSLFSHPLFFVIFFCSYCSLGLLPRQFWIICWYLGIILYPFEASYCSCLVGCCLSKCHDGSELSWTNRINNNRKPYAQITHRTKRSIQEVHSN